MSLPLPIHVVVPPQARAHDTSRATLSEDLALVCFVGPLIVDPGRGRDDDASGLLSQLDLP
jgi:hypothetical protein